MSKQQQKQTINEQSVPVPDGPFHGLYELTVAVDFTDEDGKEQHFNAGVIEGQALPVAFATSLAEQGKLIKR